MCCSSSLYGCRRGTLQDKMSKHICILLHLDTRHIILILSHTVCSSLYNLRALRRKAVHTKFKFICLMRPRFEQRGENTSKAITPLSRLHFQWTGIHILTCRQLNTCFDIQSDDLHRSHQANEFKFRMYCFSSKRS
jgi:hypothetical protein